MDMDMDMENATINNIKYYTVRELLEELNKRIALSPPLLDKHVIYREIHKSAIACDVVIDMREERK